MTRQPCCSELRPVDESHRWPKGRRAEVTDEIEASCAHRSKVLVKDGNTANCSYRRQQVLQEWKSAYVGLVPRCGYHMIKRQRLPLRGQRQLYLTLPVFDRL